MKTEIIDYISRNRVSSTEVADALYKTGAIPGVSPINRGQFKVGNVFWAFACEGTNWHVHEQVCNAGVDDIVFVEVFDCGDRAIFGDLVSKYVLLYRQAKAIVVTGYLRDAHRLIKENWPIWCTGFTPIGCVNENREVTIPADVLREHRERYNGSIAVCDDSGVVIIPKEKHDKEFLERLHLMEQQEDQWYECIDRRKWNTFDTVCLKKYLDDK